MRLHQNLLAIAALFLVLAVSWTTSPQAQVLDNSYWSTDFAVPDYLGTIHDGLQFNGEVVVCGEFAMFDSKSIATIAAFDGAEWRSLDPAPGECLGIDVWRGELVAIGYFDLPGKSGNPALFKYDGTNWELLVDDLPCTHLEDMAVYDDCVYIGDLLGLFCWDGSTFRAIEEDASQHNFSVYGLTVYDDHLILGGNLYDVGEPNSVLAWDGSAFESIGTHNATVHDVQVFDGQLVATGRFTEIGGVSADYVAAYDGSTWQSMGDGLPGRGQYLAASSEELVVSGSFAQTATPNDPSLRRWNGSQWVVLTEHATSTMFSVFSAGDDVYVAAQYTDPMSGELSRLTRYDGAGFEPQIPSGGLGIRGGVRLIRPYGDDLLAVGEFTAAGRTQAYHLARFDGTQWHSLDPDRTLSEVSKVADIIEFQGELYAGIGRGALGSESETAPVMRLQGASWVPIDYALLTDTIPHVTELFVYDNELYIAGGHFRLGSVELGNLIKWDGSTISSVPLQDEDFQITAMAEYEGDLVIGGMFEDREVYTWVYRWNGSEFETMGESLRDTRSQVHDLVVFNNSLYAAGFFTSNYDTLMYNIARWDGAHWVRVTGRPNGTVKDLHVHDGCLYAAGSFTSIGSVEAPGVAWCSGEAWHSLGSGLSPAVANCLITWDGQLAVAGDFHMAGDALSGSIAMWSGQASTCCVGVRGNIDGDSFEQVTLGDLTVLIDHLFVSFDELPCVEEANLDGDYSASVSLGDLSVLIDHLFVSFEPTLPCP